MERKIKVAFIYRKSNIFLSGQHFDNTYYHFFMDALRRNNRIEVTYFATEQIFDASKLKNKFDVILLFTNNQFGMPDEIIGIQNLPIPVISMSGDPIVAKKSIEMHDKWKIDHYFHFYLDSFFYKIYPRQFRYRTIFFGVEPSLYKTVTPFNSRIRNKILNTGSVGNPRLPSRVLSYLRSPKWNAHNAYKLRAICNSLPYVDYTSTLKHEYVNDRYPLLLQKYSASIVATTYTPNIKYWENAAAGCLTFMEITDTNRGKEFGFVDRESTIFINENNYSMKFQEYLSDLDNPVWEQIALKGREHALTNFSNDLGVEKLIKLFEDLL